MDGPAKAYPAGDYAFQVFDRIESSGGAGPGSAAALKAKALQLTGGPNSPQAPAGRNLCGLLLDQGHADVFMAFVLSAQGQQVLRTHGFSAP